MSSSKTHVKQEPLPFQKENVASNQQNVALAAFAGERLLAIRWISPALDKLVKQVPGAGKKG
ncbi:MAG: hypothetical protein WC378_14210 [Opitutaceae bacterium]|jgi:hypothetical protein